MAATATQLNTFKSAWPGQHSPAMPPAVEELVTNTKEAVPEPDAGEQPHTDANMGNKASAEEVGADSDADGPCKRGTRKNSAPEAAGEPAEDPNSKISKPAAKQNKKARRAAAQATSDKPPAGTAEDTDMGGTAAQVVQTVQKDTVLVKPDPEATTAEPALPPGPVDNGAAPMDVEEPQAATEQTVEVVPALVGTPHQDDSMGSPGRHRDERRVVATRYTRSLRMIQPPAMPNLATPTKLPERVAVKCNEVHGVMYPRDGLFATVKDNEVAKLRMHGLVFARMAGATAGSYMETIRIPLPKTMKKRPLTLAEWSTVHLSFLKTAKSPLVAALAATSSPDGAPVSNLYSRKPKKGKACSALREALLGCKGQQTEVQQSLEELSDWVLCLPDQPPQVVASLKEMLELWVKAERPSQATAYHAWAPVTHVYTLVRHLPGANPPTSQTPKQVARHRTCKDPVLAKSQHISSFLAVPKTRGQWKILEPSDSDSSESESSESSSSSDDEPIAAVQGKRKPWAHYQDLQGLVKAKLAGAVLGSTITTKQVLASGILSDTIKDTGFCGSSLSAWLAGGKPVASRALLAASGGGAGGSGAAGPSGVAGSKRPAENTGQPGSTVQPSSLKRPAKNRDDMPAGYYGSGHDPMAGMSYGAGSGWAGHPYGMQPAAAGWPGAGAAGHWGSAGMLGGYPGAGAAPPPYGLPPRYPTPSPRGFGAAPAAAPHAAPPAPWMDPHHADPHAAYGGGPAAPGGLPDGAAGGVLRHDTSVGSSDKPGASDGSGDMTNATLPNQPSQEVAAAGAHPHNAGAAGDPNGWNAEQHGQLMLVDEHAHAGGSVFGHGGQPWECVPYDAGGWHSAMYAWQQQQQQQAHIQSASAAAVAAASAAAAAAAAAAETAKAAASTAAAEAAAAAASDAAQAAVTAAQAAGDALNQAYVYAQPPVPMPAQVMPWDEGMVDPGLPLNEAGAGGGVEPMDTSGAGADLQAATAGEAAGGSQGLEGELATGGGAPAMVGGVPVEAM